MMKKLILVAAFIGAFAFSAFGQTPQPEIVTVVWEGKTFKKGDRVKVTSWAGTAKPEETGHSTEVAVDTGRTGTVVAGKKREATSYFTPDPNEPIQIVLVKWDPQTWAWAGRPVKLGSFESTIHVSYLAVVRAPKSRTVRRTTRKP